MIPTDIVVIKWYFVRIFSLQFSNLHYEAKSFEKWQDFIVTLVTGQTQAARGLVTSLYKFISQSGRTAALELSLHIIFIFLHIVFLLPEQHTHYINIYNIKT